MAQTKRIVGSGDENDSSRPFDACASKAANQLAQELSHAVGQLKELNRKQPDEQDEQPSNQPVHRSVEPSVAELHVEDTSTPNGRSASTPQNGVVDVDTQDAATKDLNEATETPISRNQQAKRKKRLAFTPDVDLPIKKSKQDDEIQRSCEECLVSGK